jgi:hypothetical protein
LFGLFGGGIGRFVFRLMRFGRGELSSLGQSGDGFVGWRKLKHDFLRHGHVRDAPSHQPEGKRQTRKIASLCGWSVLGEVYLVKQYFRC